MKTGLPARNRDEKVHPGGDLGLFSELQMHILSSLLDIATLNKSKVLPQTQYSMLKIEYVGCSQHVLNMVLFTFP